MPYKKQLLKNEYNNDVNFGMIQVDYDTSLMEIYKASIEGFMKAFVKFKKYARKCEITGEGMNEGFVFGDGAGYCKYEKDALIMAKKEGFKTLEEAYKSGAYYWTEWEDKEDYQYYVNDFGDLIEF